MTNKCAKCGRTESQTTADAKTLGLLQELQCRVYTCCQITEWADEQWLAWVEATQQNTQLIDDASIRPEFNESEVMLVPVRLCRQQVPWFRNTNDLG
jgi:hypothetical protein